MTSSDVLQGLRYRLFSDTHSSSSTWITHSATSPVSEMSRENVSDYLRLPLELQKALNYFHIHSSAPQDLFTHLNVENWWRSPLINHAII